MGNRKSSETREILAQGSLKPSIAVRDERNEAGLYAFFRDLMKEGLKEVIESRIIQPANHGAYPAMEARGGSDGTGFVYGECAPSFSDQFEDGEYEAAIGATDKLTNTIDGDLETEIIDLFGRGFPLAEITAEIKKSHNKHVSEEAISKLADRLGPDIKEWQGCRLQPAYAFLVINTEYFSVRHEGHVTNRGVHILVGVTLGGTKEILGFWQAAQDTPKLWAIILNELKNRGVQDIMIVIADKINGINEALAAVYPTSKLQRSLVHQHNRTLRFVSWNDTKKFKADICEIYKAGSEADGLERLSDLEAKWQGRYPFALKNWKENWDELGQIYKYPANIRKTICSSNAINKMNDMFKAIARKHKLFASPNSLEKIIYLCAVKFQNKWTQRAREWDKVMNELYGVLPELMEKHLKY
jgi:transposase-like protein